MKTKLITIFLAIGLMFLTGCASYNPGFGFNSPSNTTGTRAMMEHSSYDESGQLRDHRVARVEIQGENLIEALDLRGNMEDGKVLLKSDSWQSSKTEIVRAQGKREAGNTEAVGDAAAEAANPIGSAISDVIEAGSEK